MAENHTISTLTAKRAEIEASILNYERRLKQARADVAHIDATITIFQTPEDRDSATPYTDLHRVFVRGEIITICKAALLEHGPMNTLALASHVIAAKGLDSGDRVLAKAVAGRLIHALRMQAKRGKLRIGGKERGAIVWALNEP